MNDLIISDYRDEFHLKIFRRWHVIKSLCSNKKFSDGVPLEKASFVDFLVSNPNLLHNILVHFNRAEPSLNLEELLYQDNMEFGSAHDVKDFGKTCIFLIKMEYIKFSKNQGEVYLSGDNREIFLDNMLSHRWKKEIDLLQPILGKSMNVLSSAVLEIANGN